MWKPLPLYAAPSIQWPGVQLARLEGAAFLLKGGRNDISSDRISFSPSVATEPCQEMMHRHHLVTEAGLGRFHGISSWRTSEFAKPPLVETPFHILFFCLFIQGILKSHKSNHHALDPSFQSPAIIEERRIEDRHDHLSL